MIDQRLVVGTAQRTAEQVKGASYVSSYVAVRPQRSDAGHWHKAPLLQAEAKQVAWRADEAACSGETQNGVCGEEGDIGEGGAGVCRGRMVERAQSGGRLN